MKWLLIIALGGGDVEVVPFATFPECHAAQRAVIEATDSWWRGPGWTDVTCVEMK